MDGAFVIDHSGNIVSLVKALSPPRTNRPLVGLGTRHRAAVDISAVTRCVAIVVSHSAGHVRAYLGGREVYEFGPYMGL